ncbi:hypothetical protein D8X77_17940 [Vibrio vulnificus]|nr:hypothetical protein [Vibrio vulnificus]
MEFSNDYSGYGNEVLYRMCAEKPLHNDIDVIASKLWIIGRSYSASIERKAGSNFDIRDAAEIIRKSKIDSKIANITVIERPDLNNLNVILETHSYFLKLLKEATGIEKRSLASKYLHFHAPKAVFIYDSIANREIRARLKGRRFPISGKHDKEYTAFCHRAIYYRDNVFEQQIGALTTPRRLDMHLLGYYEQGA